jgi:hypothetical protein
MPRLSKPPFAELAFSALAMGALLAGFAVRGSAQEPGQPALTAADILHAVREGQAGRHETLEGQLRDDSNDKVYPFRLVADGPLVRYLFAGNPPVTVQVQYKLDSSTLEESGPDGGKLSAATFDHKILGTDLTFEDLALRFLYWSRATVEGDDRIDTRSSWKLRLQSPTRASQYSNVELWVDKQSGALLQAETYDWSGRLSKRFKVVSGQKLAGKWYLKQMRIESFDPGTTHVHSRTYLEINKLAPAAG